ncbi:methyltransferase-like protein 2 isoform X2 [Elaeis guineensis]|uniref:Methyltransferase-like protein 2 isoform X2 n=1 Tax=Elaeis guineensis var. tenera TaxID=51953 RepID=A0A6I9SGZ3_ELAGV|nr:methyltransferase-like protein 2 isoform X2 [Elaeis guineensis]
MEERISDEFKSFLDSGIYRLDGSKVVFVDPVRLLNDSYSRFRISPSSYYSRSFQSTDRRRVVEEVNVPSISKKKRKRKKTPRDLNEREKSAEKRHQEARSLLLKAHRAFLEAAELQTFLPKLVKCVEFSRGGETEEKNFIELGSCWQAPLYEIGLCFPKSNEGEDSWLANHVGRTVVPLFNNLISHETNDEVEAEFNNSQYILPGRSCFYMSDLRQIRNLIPAKSDQGFNLIVIDPPWENGSARQKAAYPTLPNRYFLYLPVKELAHAEGALVALWMTNREKLHMFVEKDLFPAWGVTNVTLCYWLKVKPDGSLIGELDLFHHRPYEYLLLGYINMENIDSECMPAVNLEDARVIISIPGVHSRKPALGKLLWDHIPGNKPVKCIELFARELMAGWTSWGNEPLHFQDSRYFVEKDKKDGLR